jgi:hypothetical protein
VGDSDEAARDSEGASSSRRASCYCSSEPDLKHGGDSGGAAGDSDGAVGDSDEAAEDSGGATGRSDGASSSRRASCYCSSEPDLRHGGDSDEVVGDSDEAADDNDEAGDSEGAVGDSDETAGDSDGVMGDSDKAAGNSDRLKAGILLLQQRARLDGGKRERPVAH